MPLCDICNERPAVVESCLNAFCAECLAANAKDDAGEPVTAESFLAARGGEWKEIKTQLQAAVKS